MQKRVAALTNQTWGQKHAPTASWQPIKVNLMEPIGSNAAVVLWREKELQPDRQIPVGNTSGNLWPEMTKALESDKAELETVCEAVLGGPIRFHLDARKGSGILLIHLAALKSLVQSLGRNEVLELHTGRYQEAWTNLLASTRMVTAWQPEPHAVSYLVWFAMGALDYNNLWQALQAPVWTEKQLADLQQEWEQVNFLARTPEIASFTRACMAALCQQERIQSIQSGITPQGTIRDPKGTLNQAGYFWDRLKYRDHGSYADENAILLHFRDRELETKRAIQSKTWLEMRQLPGVTNTVLFQSTNSPGLQSIINMKQWGISMLSQGGTLLSRAAEAEMRRRLMVAAIALERFHLSKGAYPQTIQELAQQFLKNPPIDFADGQPLRYHLGSDGHFSLYSLGLDGVDNNGRLPKRRLEMPRTAVKEESDLVWPRPASHSEVETEYAGQNKAREEVELKAELSAETEAEQSENERLARVNQLLATRPSVRGREPRYKGRLLRDLLRLKPEAARPSRTLKEMLTPARIATDEEPQFVTFEVPINYYAATNIGRLQLEVDPLPDQVQLDDSMGEATVNQELKRSTNGACQIVLNTVFYRPTNHAIQIFFGVTESETNYVVSGAPIPLTVSNLCQVSLEGYQFDERGARFYAKLVETNGLYKIDLTSTDNERIKTFTGSTATNGLIRERWDLLGDDGKRYTNDSFNAVYHITLPDSGRAQTIR